MKRLVVKVGTSTLMTPEGRLDRHYVSRLCAAVSHQKSDGQQVALVTSGAVGTGADHLGASQPRTIPQKQAAAAVGQGLLMQAYSESFGACGVTAAQLLLTRQDIADRTRYTNAHNTFEALFHYSVVPVVNENDTVAVDEIRFGDNDTLAATVALIIDADLVVILSDVQGLYNPASKEKSTIPVISEVNASVDALARPISGGPGTGGMVTKLRAARVLTRAGIPLIIGHGRDDAMIPAAVDRWQTVKNGKIDTGTPGTLFLPCPHRIRGRKRWIAFAHRARGNMVVNERAAAELVENGRSLLAAGVTDVSGAFQTGDLVRILDAAGKEIGRGLSNFSVDEIRVVKGRQSKEISELLGRETLKEVIHRDNLVMGL